MTAHAGVDHGYGYHAGRRSDDPRPLVAVDVDGVVALDPPAAVPATWHDVSAWERWRREVLVPDVAAEVLRALAARCELAWTSAWSYTAHEALRPALDLPEEPWAFLPAQFDAVDRVREYAAGRRWAWIAERALVGDADGGDDGLVVAVDPHVGLGTVDAAAVVAALRA